MHMRRWAVVVILCIVITTVLASYKILQIRKAIAFAESFPEHSETVSTVTAKQVTWSPTVKVIGEVKAIQSIELRNEVEGKIVSVGFKPGANVKKNQLLVQLDISQELAQLKAAKAEATLAQLELERYQRLVKEKLSSKEQYDHAKAQMAVASAGVQALRATISKKTLKAPFNASTGLHHLEVGQYLASNTLITKLVGHNHSVWVDFYLPQQQATLPIGTNITVAAPGLLTQTINGTIIAKDAAVTVQSRNLRFRAHITSISEQLTPGAIIEVSIDSAQKKPVIVLPMTAVRRDHFGANVYVLHIETPEPPEGEKIRATKRAVTIGTEYEDHIIITHGVQPGELIANNGSYKLRDGMQVHIKEASNSNINAAKQHEASP